MTSTNPFGVRRATPADSQPLFDWLIPLYAESALQPVSATKVRALVERCVNGDAAMAGIIEGDGGIEASIGLIVTEWDYTDAQHLAVRWAFVHPDFRRVNHLHRLMRFAAWCYEGVQAMTETPLPLVSDILTRDDLEPKMRLYQRSFPQVGALFALGCVPDKAFDQVRLDDGRGDRKGRVPQERAHRRSPLLAGNAA